MYPTREKAMEILLEAQPHNPGPWVAHSVTVAECAEKIAAKSGLNDEKAYALGLLHDIGRRFGVSHFGHVVDGYRYMTRLGFDEAARICLTHSFPTHEFSEYIGKLDVPDADIKEMEALLRGLEYDGYDRLIQLCDSVAGAGEILSLDQRMDDVQRRYGNYPEEKRAANRALKAHFEKACGENLYQVMGAGEELWGK